MHCDHSSMAHTGSLVPEHAADLLLCLPFACIRVVKLSAPVAQAKEHLQAAVSSFQVCIATAVQASQLATAVEAAEAVMECLGTSDSQAAAEALLMAQSCQAVTIMTDAYKAAAPAQVHTFCKVVIMPLDVWWILAKWQKWGCMAVMRHFGQA